MPVDDCGQVEIHCRELEKCLRRLHLIPRGCKLDEGRRITIGGTGYVFALKPAPAKDRATKKAKKK